MTETIDSITDQDRIVSFMERLKYSLNIQKPGSFTCENKRLPRELKNGGRTAMGYLKVNEVNSDNRIIQTILVKADNEYKKEGHGHALTF